MKKRLLIFSLIALSGCASVSRHLPGYYEESESKVEGTQQKLLNPASVNANDSSLILGVLWKSNFNKDEVIIIAGLEGIKAIAPGQSLTLKIDNEVFKLTSTDLMTDTRIEEVRRESVRRYKGSLEMVKKLANSKQAFMKLDLIENSYVEAEFKDVVFYSARPALKEFLNKLEPRTPAGKP